MFMQKTKRACAMLCAGLIAIAAGAARAATDLTVVTVWPQNNYHVKNLEQFAQKVREVTRGEVTLTIHSGGSLGLKGPELLGSLRDGIVDMADMLITQQVGEEPLLGLEAVPYLTRSLDELALLQEVARPYYDKIAARNNQKILYLVPWPGQGLFSKASTDGIAGFQGIKVRTVERNGTDLFKALGAAPIQMPWGEVIPALASGAIDGVSTSSPSGVDGKFWEFLGYFNRMNWQVASQAVSVNLDAWKRLSREHQQAIEDAARALQPKFWQVADAEDKANIDVLMKNNIQVTSPSEALAAALTQAAQPLWDAFAQRVGPEARSIIAEYRAKTGR